MKKIWTKEKCRIEALKYEFRSDFNKNSGSAYHASLKYKILDEICSHMKNIGHQYKRCIYVYEFLDNSVYVGLTFNLDKRHKQHLKKGTVYNYIQLGKEYELKQLTDYIDVNSAKKKEYDFVKQYKTNGWKILNKSKTGGLGSTKNSWSKEKCQIEALKYTTRFEFQKKSNGAYNSAWSNKWLNDICSHMINRVWTKEKCQIEALKYSSREEYSMNSSGSYCAALKNKWLNDICSHMVLLMKRNYWNFEKCKEESLKYKNRTEFSKKSPYVYKISRKNGWLNEICNHMN